MSKKIVVPDGIKGWGLQLNNDRDKPELGYGWHVYIETMRGERHERTSKENKPHKQAKRNAQAALMRLRHKVGGTKPQRRLSMDASIWARELGITV